MPKNVLIASFSIRDKTGRTPINGMIGPLLSFFRPKYHQVDLIDGPHPGSSTVITHFENYTKHKLTSAKSSLISFLLFPILILANRDSTQFIFKIRDFLTVFEILLRNRRRYDLFIGLESVYTIAGIIGKYLGFISRIVYYVSDYSPNRYPNFLVNKFYLWLDRYCCSHADFIWDVSPAMMPARVKAGLKPQQSAPLILVPNALFPSQIAPADPNSVIPYSLVYAGTLGPENGVDIAIAAVQKIRQKYPAASLHIYGSGHEFEPALKLLINKSDLQKQVIFHGFIGKLDKLTKIISQYALGIAPYRYFPGSPRLYADATKLRLYLGAGLPVVTTQVPPLGRELASRGAAVISQDNDVDLAKTVMKIFFDRRRYTKLRLASIRYAKTNTWENTYRSALAQMKLSAKS